MEKQIAELKQLVKINTSHGTFHNQEEYQTNRENYATQALISMAEDHPLDQMDQMRNSIDRIREETNGSEITSWKNNYLNIAKKECESTRRKRRFKIRPERQSLKEQSFLENVSFAWNFGLPAKKQLNKLRLPLREKTLNSEQFASFSMQKQRSKTRNEIKMQILSSKPQITPIMKIRKTLKTEWKCYNIIKERDELKQYKKIKRNQFYTLENNEGQQNMLMMGKTKSKTLTNRPESPRMLRLKGGSIKRLIIE